MGLRRLNVDSHFSAEELAKVKKRKTRNQSKKVKTHVVHFYPGNVKAL